MTKTFKTDIGMHLELYCSQFPNLKAKYGSNISDSAEIGYFIEMIEDILGEYGISYPYFNEYKGKTATELGYEKAIEIYNKFLELIGDKQL